MAAALMPEQDYADQIVRGDGRTRRQVLEAICERIGNGHLVKHAAEAEGTSAQTIWKWALASTELSELYAHAREKQAHALAEQIIEISDEPVTTSEEAARNRLRVDARKWYTAKVAPKLYGDKTHTEVAITASVLHLDALKASATNSPPPGTVGTTITPALSPLSATAKALPSQVVDAEDVTDEQA